MLATTGQNSIDIGSFNRSSPSKGYTFDRSQIIYSPTKGETGNQIGNEADLSIIDTKRGQNNQNELILNDIDLSADVTTKITFKALTRRTEPPRTEK